MTHSVYKHGKFYAHVDPSEHDVKQYCTMLAKRFPGNVFEARDENDRPYYSHEHKLSLRFDDYVLTLKVF